jgi:Protein of unknown function (DUF3396)
MSVDVEEAMKELDEHMTVKDDDGRVVLQVALLVTLYFADPHRREVREAVASCCEDYFQWCGAGLRWALNPDKKLPEPYGQGKGSDPRSWLTARGEEGSFSFICHAAEHERGASSLSLETFGAELRPYDQLGYFKASFPLLWFSAGRGSFSEKVLALCAKLKPVSGYAGIGVIESPDDSISSKYAPIVYEWAQRFPGLEADYPIEHSIWLVDGREGGKGGLKGVNWLTVVGDRWIEEMGRIRKVETDLAELDSRYVIQRFEGGVVIQAGERPQLGNAERGRWPELYVKLSKYLKPIRITRHCPFQYDGPGVRFDLERSKGWLRRFDDR